MGSPQSVRKVAMRAYARAETLCEEKDASPFDHAEAHRRQASAEVWGDPVMRTKLAKGDEEKAARILGVSLGSARLAAGCARNRPSPESLLAGRRARGSFGGSFPPARAWIASVTRSEAAFRERWRRPCCQPPAIRSALTAGEPAVPQHQTRSSHVERTFFGCLRLIADFVAAGLLSAVQSL